MYPRLSVCLICFVLMAGLSAAVLLCGNVLRDMDEELPRQRQWAQTARAAGEAETALLRARADLYAFLALRDSAKMRQTLAALGESARHTADLRTYAAQFQAGDGPAAMPEAGRLSALEAKAVEIVRASQEIENAMNRIERLHAETVPAELAKARQIVREELGEAASPGNPPVRVVLSGGLVAVGAGFQAYAFSRSERDEASIRKDLDNIAELLGTLTGNAEERKHADALRKTLSVLRQAVDSMRDAAATVQWRLAAFERDVLEQTGMLREISFATADNAGKMFTRLAGGTEANLGTVMTVALGGMALGFMLSLYAVTILGRILRGKEAV